MCTSPLHIKNPSKFISLSHRDRLYIDVPCGHCVECRNLQKLQWYHRSIIEFQSIISSGGYCLFDTLTYDNKNLPYASDVFNISGLDFACFNHDDVTKFLKRLRKSLSKKYGYDGLRYACFSEYGTNPNCSHRPHYHLLLFCHNCVPPIELSELVSNSWGLGRTDGFPYQSRNYVLSKRVYSDLNDVAKFQVIQYVTKYVNKSNEFQDVVDARIGFIISQYLADKPKDFEKSVEYRQFVRSVYRQLGQFHRQSIGFGAQILQETDLLDLMRLGGFKVSMPKSVVAIVPLSTYYKRKLFYELVEYDGQKFWQLNDVGLEFVPLFEKRKIDNFVSKLKAYDVSNNNVFSKRLFALNYNYTDLAIYALNLSGCTREYVPVYRLEDKLDDELIFHYGSERDEKYFGFRFYSPNYCGLYGSYIYPTSVISDIDIDKFIIKDNELDNILSDFYLLLHKHNDILDDAYKVQERVTNIYKQYGLLQSTF